MCPSPKIIPSKKSAFEGVQLTIVDALMPVLDPFLDIITKIFRWVSDLPTPLKVTGVAFLGVLAAVGPLMMVLGQMLIHIPKLVAVFGILKTFMLTKLIPTIIATITALWAKVTALFAVLAASGPAGWIALAAGIVIIGTTAAVVTMHLNNTKEAIDEIYRRTSGLPRAIVQHANEALTKAAVDKHRKVTKDDVLAAAAELSVNEH